uniref:Uncharacterized protein n=1 Tax=uncultured Elusimicrobia bacterium TaxID=699876 RepID=A0A650EN27_9BACT|nr:hypothetical protein Elusimicrob1349_1910 [uncultured Elusimicrobia bacterium]
MGLGSFVKKVGGSSFGKALGLNDSYGAITDPIGFLTGENAAKAQNEQQLQWWNMQNEYNSPAAQMARYKAAGLNPNLVSGQISSGNASSVGSAAAGDGGANSLSKVSSTVAAIYGLKGMKADIANKYAQNANLKENNSLLSSQTEMVRQQARRMAYETDWLEKHGTSSFDNNWIKGLKSLTQDNRSSIDPLLENLATFLGTARGRLDTISLKDIFYDSMSRFPLFGLSISPKRALDLVIHGARSRRR